MSSKAAIHLSIATAIISGMLCAVPVHAAPVAADASSATLDVYKGRTRGHNGFPKGQCTWLAQERFKQQHGFYMDISGNAQDWDTAARNAGWNVRTDRPFKNSVVVFEAYVAGAGSVGHVAWVTSAGKNSKGGYQMHIEEMNWNGNPNPTKRNAVQWGPGMSVITNQ